MIAQSFDSVSTQEAARRTKRRGLMLAAFGYLLGIAVLWLCRWLGLSSTSLRELMWCIVFFLANSLLLLLVLQSRLDGKLLFDPHFIYIPVFLSILWLTYYLYVAHEARSLLFSVIFLPFVFMVSLVGLRDGLIISSLFVIAYLTLLLHLSGYETLNTQAEGVRVTVFFLVMVFSCLIMERTKRHREKYIATVKEVATLQEIGKTLVSTLVVDQLVEQILAIIKERFGYVNCSLWTLEKASHELVLRAQKGFVSLDNSSDTRLPLSGPGITVWVALRGSMANVGNVQQDSRYTTANLTSDCPTVSELTLPLKRHGEVFAILDVQSGRLNGFTRNDERVLSAVADYASIALANARWVDVRANRDGLTGLYNHRFLMEQLELELHRMNRLGKPCSFVMCDIDRFKSINDVHGHLTGDAILKQVSVLLMNSLRDSDIIARYGGDEFSAILPNTTRPDALGVAEKLRHKTQEAVFWGDHHDGPYRATASFGVATYPEDAHTPADLIRLADERLYQAKQRGRNCVLPSPVQSL
ncbi:MAG: sensor domain-containing diguanylate cyclase [Acidobacteriia bacterium]|nr:sensor domain-containing diguanylate cyclase [Terriglobia bacterium]